ncbi:chemotaxis protein CheW [Sphingomonas sp. GlSt437]|uniref:chemotaxis protein CheW n=1 Tax=Sphingomonas sp. GlSt437 TaxID=3389970 RepID=UPI003A87B44E
MSKDLFLVAYLAGRTVAIDSAEVDSVVDIGQVTPVPCAYRDVAGLAALRSRVVTVIDPRGALGLPVVERAKSRAIITVIDGHHYAILVDGLEDVAPFQRLPLDGGITLDNGWRRAGRALIERDGEPILVVDLRALVPGLAAVA